MYCKNNVQMFENELSKHLSLVEKLTKCQIFSPTLYSWRKQSESRI